MQERPRECIRVLRSVKQYWGVLGECHFMLGSEYEYQGFLGRVWECGAVRSSAGEYQAVLSSAG